MNKNWWKCALVRAVYTVAQSAVAVIGTATLLSDIDWEHVILVGAAAGILSLLCSLRGLPEIKLADKCERLKGRLKTLTEVEHEF